MKWSRAVCEYFIQHCLVFMILEGDSVQLHKHLCDVVFAYSQRTTVKVPKAQCVYTWDLPYIQNMGCLFFEQ